ncbi:MAG: DUF6488 family protein [Gammaproteobacteria bacterium]|nr:DUF6488 family protein [Gammaproteobacteria bacterium]
MQLKILLLGLFLSLCSATAMAGSGHDHGHSHEPVNQETAETNATKIIAVLVKKEKLQESWASTTASSVEKRVFKGTPEWVAVFVNDKITDPAKQKLYIFMTLGGDYLAANFTGE